MNKNETSQADSRKKRNDQGRDEKRKEGETRAAAVEANENDPSRRPKKKSAGARPRKNTKWPGTGYEVADLTHEAHDRG